MFGLEAKKYDQNEERLKLIDELREQYPQCPVEEIVNKIWIKSYQIFSAEVMMKSVGIFKQIGLTTPWGIDDNKKEEWVIEDAEKK